MPTQVVVIKKNYAGTAHIFQAMTAVVLIAAGIYGYMQYQKLNEAQTALLDEQAKSVNMQVTVNDTSTAYDAMKKKADVDTTEIINQIQAVYPADQNYTSLTTMLDSFFEDNNKADNRLFNSSLTIGLPIIDANKDYVILPFTMSLDASRENFEKFLRYVDSSGDLESGVRLMNIKNISLSLPAENIPGTENAGTEVSKDLAVSVSMDTYFQKPVAGTP